MDYQCTVYWIILFNLFNFITFSFVKKLLRKFVEAQTPPMLSLSKFGGTYKGPRAAVNDMGLSLDLKKLTISQPF